MLERLIVSRARYESDSDAVFMEAVINNQTAVEPMSVHERIVFYADQYVSCIMMDGHLLAFCNNGPKHASEWAKSLAPIGASSELAMLSDAFALWMNAGAPAFGEQSDALAEAIAVIDERFYAAMESDGNLEDLTKKYVGQHLDAFIAFE